jgi:hypothetical protein
MEIQAYIFNTEEEVKGKILEIDNVFGFPDEGALTYCSYEFNNNKWIVKFTQDMLSVFGYEPSSFNYVINSPFS